MNALAFAQSQERHAVSQQKSSAIWRVPRLQRKCACGGTPGPSGECAECKRKRLGIQTKLTINQPGDQYEQEADRMAEAVVGGASNRPPISSLGNFDAGQRKAGNDHEAAGIPPIVDEVLASRGQPLNETTHNLMLNRLGHHFGHVRIHVDARAAESARAVHAHAYTVGSHIAFANGRYAPSTVAGQKLIAHELTHVIQQSAGASSLLQRDDKPPTDRIDVSIVFSDDDTSMAEGRSYATTALRVTSCEDAKKQLLALGKPLGRIYVVSHSNQSGQIQVVSPGGVIMVKLSECSKDLKGLPANIAPTEIDFRGCKLGEAPEQMETFRKNVGAKSARAGNCWSIVAVIKPLTVDGVPLTKESQVPEGKKAEIDGALKTKINSLKSEDGHSVKDCLIGLARGEKADTNFSKLRKLYFEHGGNLTAGWASPEFNQTWQKGSICVKDMTATTSPCKIVTTSEPGGSGAGAEKKSGALEAQPADMRNAGDLIPAEEGERLA